MKRWLGPLRIASTGLVLAACGSSEKSPELAAVDVDVPTARAAESAPLTSAAPIRTAEPDPRSTRPDAGVAATAVPSIAISASTVSSPPAAQPASPADARAIEAALVAATNAGQIALVADGAPRSGRFEQGDALEVDAVMQPGKCYAALAVSSGGITELDLGFVAVVAIPNLPPLLLATDGMTGPSAGIGVAGAGCFKFPFPIPMPIKVRVIAAAGAGLAAVQLFSK